MAMSRIWSLGWRRPEYAGTLRCRCRRNCDQRFPAAGGDFKDLHDPCEPIAARETSDLITELEPGPES